MVRMRIITHFFIKKNIFTKFSKDFHKNECKGFHDICKRFLLTKKKCTRTTPSKFSGKRDGSPMDSFKWQVFYNQTFPRHALSQFSVWKTSKSKFFLITHL